MNEIELVLQEYMKLNGSAPESGDKDEWKAGLADFYMGWNAHKRAAQQTLDTETATCPECLQDEDHLAWCWLADNTYDTPSGHVQSGSV